MQRLLTLLQGSQFKLKLFVWLVFLTLCASSAMTWFVANKMGQHVYPRLFPHDAPNQVTITMNMARSEGFWLTALLPWFCYALICGLKPNVSSKSCLIFSGTAVLAQALFIAILIDSSILWLFTRVDEY